jgi:ABC-2 type transport system permease protein
MREIFFRELRAHRRALIGWTLAIAVLLVMVISIQPTMAQKGSALEAKLEVLPDAMKKLFGLQGLDFTRPGGYLAVNFLYVTLTAPLSAAILGANLVAKEESLRTAEILLTQPISRTRILLGKCGALAVHIALYHLVLAGITLAGLAIVVKGSIEAPMIVSLFAGTAALAVCFGGLGMLVATLVPRPRTAGNAALTVVLGGYLLSALGAITPSLEWLAWLSPFHWVAPTRILHHGGLEPATGVIFAIGLAAAATAIARYARRDILL